MGWLRYLHNRTSILTKVLVANALLMGIGSVAAVRIATRLWAKHAPSPVAQALFIVAALALSLTVNFLVLRLAFRPLFFLKSILDRVRRGDFSARVPEIDGAPEIGQISATANLMLDRLTQHRQAVAAQTLRALEEERKRIARELHDETSQSLTSIMVNLDVIEHQLPSGSDETASRIHLTREIARRTLDETRRLMFDLRPSALDDLGLVPALRWFISQRVHPMGVPVRFCATGFDERLPEDLETALFRIMQEAITNAVKHSRAKSLVVTLYRRDGQITGEVQDDGVGFHPVQMVGQNEKDRGMGLFGMQERAALVGGAVYLQSAPGKGTTVRFTVPERTKGGDAGE